MVTILRIRLLCIPQKKISLKIDTGSKPAHVSGCLRFILCVFSHVLRYKILYFKRKHDKIAMYSSLKHLFL